MENLVSPYIFGGTATYLVEGNSNFWSILSRFISSILSVPASLSPQMVLLGLENDYCLSAMSIVLSHVLFATRLEITGNGNLQTYLFLAEVSSILNTHSLMEFMHAKTYLQNPKLYRN